MEGDEPSPVAPRLWGDLAGKKRPRPIANGQGQHAPAQKMPGRAVPQKKEQWSGSAGGKHAHDRASLIESGLFGGRERRGELNLVLHSEEKSAVISSKNYRLLKGKDKDRE